MSDAAITDDELDQRVRAAAAALLALAPAGQLDLAARVEAELAELDVQRAAPTTVETPMTSDPDSKPGSTTVTPPAAAPGRTEDSGLHDIRSLAHDTKKRISRRITSQHDIDDRMLASSTGSLRAIALPEPAMIVALPEAPASMDEVRSAMAADPALARAAASIPRTPRKRTGLWLGAGGVAVAAAAAVVILAGGGSKPASPPAPAMEASRAPAPGPGTPAISPGAVAPAPPPPSTAQAAVATPETGAMGSAAPPAADVAPAPVDRGGDARTPRTGSAADHGTATGAGTGTAKPGGGSAKVGGPGAGGAGGGSAKPGGGGKPPAGGAGAGSGSGEKSIEDLLNDASGGGGGGGKTAGGGGGGGGGDDGPKDPAVAAKTQLEPKEIKAGMSSVAGLAQACYGKFSVAGHVKVKAVVAPSGAVTKVDALGEFAGTPTGSCVAGAVKEASFPSWTGAPMSITYSFTLQE